ncbi:Zinc finger MYND domain-containing protein 12 [Borealophlyctis nickersoniae]|nr:Zinc finger MYND domain-containing protein 12 [Borealophlyctis nickersoniae]
MSAGLFTYVDSDQSKPACWIYRTPVAVLGSEEERAHREKQTRFRQVQLLELTKTEAHKKLFEGQYDLAIPAALQALRFSMDVYGQNSIELVPSYLLLGEASIGLKQYSQAEDYLSLAKWAVLKAPTCADSVRAQLCRNFGLLYSSEGSFDEALQQLALDGGIGAYRFVLGVDAQIYYSSLAKGPEHISDKRPINTVMLILLFVDFLQKLGRMIVSGGYFQLGNVFEKQNRIDNATALFDRVVAIWKKTLMSGSETLDEAQQAEANQMLTAIYTFRTRHSQSVTLPPEVHYVLAMLHRTCGRPDKAKEFAQKALEGIEWIADE